jgi:DNA-directed RNA polymerase subunit RPC12/RpoP
MEPVTRFRILIFSSLLSVWRKKLSVVYWCRACGKKNKGQIQYNESYPKYLCKVCGTKNILNIKY